MEVYNGNILETCLVKGILNSTPQAKIHTRSIVCRGGKRILTFGEKQERLHVEGGFQQNFVGNKELLRDRSKSKVIDSGNNMN